MVQQLCTSPKIQSKSQAMPRASKVRLSTHKASAQMTHTQWYFMKLNNTQYLSVIDVSSGYHNLKLDKKSSYLTPVACKFGRYMYKRLLFGTAPAGDMC